MSGIVSLNCHGVRERMPLADIKAVEFGRGGVMFSKESLERMGLDADMMYIVCRMEYGETKLFETLDYVNMVFMGA